MDKELPNKQGMLLDMYGNEEFSRDVIRQFPTLRAELKENAGLLHVQMSTLADAVRRFLDDTLSRSRAIPEIENAVAISFVAAQEFKETVTGRVVLEQMPKRVQEILLEQDPQ